jgi:heme-degrading monooxygenase HmoA
METTCHKTAQRPDDVCGYFRGAPKAQRWDDYLEFAKFLQPGVERIDGFIETERFASQRHKGRLMSLSTRRDKNPMMRWCTRAEHHRVQETGRLEVFQDYRWRAGAFTADNKVPEGQTLAQHRFDQTDVGEAKYITISEPSPVSGETPASSDLPRDLGLPATGANGLLDYDVFDGIHVPGKRLLLASWRDERAAGAWSPQCPPQGVLRHRQVRVIRDAGMRDRREAPQYCEDVR